MVDLRHVIAGVFSPGVLRLAGSRNPATPHDNGSILKNNDGKDFMISRLLALNQSSQINYFERERQFETSCDGFARPLNQNSTLTLTATPTE